MQTIEAILNKIFFKFTFVCSHEENPTPTYYFNWEWYTGTCNCFKKKLSPDRLLKMENRDTCKPSNSYVSFNFHLCLPTPPRHHIC